MAKLGVNLDHVATIRQQRYTPYPDMLTAIKISEDGNELVGQLAKNYAELKKYKGLSDEKVYQSFLGGDLDFEFGLIFCQVDMSHYPVSVLTSNQFRLLLELDYDDYIRSNLEAILANIDPSHDDTDDSKNKDYYDYLRSLDSKKLKIKFNIV